MSEEGTYVGLTDRKATDTNLVEVRVGKISQSAMIDTGAQISCMSYVIFKKSGLAEQFELQSPDIEYILGVSGTPVKVMGTAVLPLTICKLEIQQKFYIFEKFRQSIILGVDFLTCQRARVDFENYTLEVQGGMTATKMFSKPQKLSLARTVNKISIPSKTVVVTKVKVKNPNSRNLSLIEPITSLASKHCIMGARSVSKIRGGFAYVKLLNPTSADIEIKQNEPIARLHPCDEQDLCNKNNEESIIGAGIYTVGVPTCGSDKPQLSDDEYINIAKAMGVDLSQSDLTDIQKHQLLVMLGKNRDIFATSIAELGTTNLHYHRIETGNAKPIRRPPYRTTPEKRTEISRQVEEMEKHGIISKSTSQWSSPVILVRKKSGEYRFAVDFRALNSVTEPIDFPVTHFQDAVDSIGQANASVYSVLDMHSGFWQIPLHEDTKDRTGFTTHEGNYVFNKLPFGLMNSPNAFAMVMSEVLRGINWRFAQVYVDDILVYSSDFEQHLKHLQEIFDRLWKANLKLKPSKCHFAAKEVKYLGHKFTKEGIMVDENKIASVTSYPRPRSQKDVRAYLDLCNYYRKFVKGFAEIARPLNRLLGKDVKFEWKEECENSFNQLKRALIESPVLKFPNFSERFYLYVDASNQAISYILGQKDEKNREYVISYGGRSLNKTERNWGNTDLEGLALVEGIRHFKVYLSDKSFTVYSDHLALKSLKTSKATGRLGRWAVFLQGFQYKVVHKPGKIHSNADSLSRRAYEEAHKPYTHTSEDPDDLSLGPEVASVDIEGQKEIREYKLNYEDDSGKINAIYCSKPNDSLSFMIHAIDIYESLDPLEHVREVCPISLDDLRKEQKEDPNFKSMIAYLEEKQVPDDRNEANRIVAEAQYYIIENGILYHLYQPRSKGHKWTDVKKQLAVPRKMRDNVLKSYHDALTGGHQGQERTYEAIRLKYFWPKMFSDIQTYVKTCEECQRAKRYIHQKQALLKPLPVGHVFSRLHIDILGPLPKSKDGFRYILMIVDSFSKWTEALPLLTMESREIAWKLYDEIICRFGCPDSILTDRGQNFMSLLLKELCQILRITKLSTSSYHAACNAQVERMNSVVLQKLRIYGNENQTDWAQLLPSIMFSYRTTPAIDSTNFSPYYILFGRECKMPLDTELIPSTQLKQTTEQHLNRIIQNQKIVRDIVSENITKAQAKYKAQHDKRAAPSKYDIQSNVWLYNPRTPKGLSPKLINRWEGPFYVSEKLSDCNFRLRNLKTHKAIKAVVHANRLKPYFDPNTRPTNTPPDIQEPVEIYDTDEEDEEEKRHDQQNDTQKASEEEDLQQANTTATLQDHLTPERILRAYPNFRGEGRMLYKVKYRDSMTDKTQTTYTYDMKLPETMRKDFHIKYTYSGKVRKRPPHKPTGSDQ